MDTLIINPKSKLFPISEKSKLDTFFPPFLTRKKTEVLWGVKSRVVTRMVRKVTKGKV